MLACSDIDTAASCALVPAYNTQGWQAWRIPTGSKSWKTPASGSMATSGSWSKHLWAMDTIGAAYSAWKAAVSSRVFLAGATETPEHTEKLMLLRRLPGGPTAIRCSAAFANFATRIARRAKVRKPPRLCKNPTTSASLSTKKAFAPDLGPNWW